MIHRMLLLCFCTLTLSAFPATAGCEKGKSLYDQAMQQSDPQKKISLLEQSVSECPNFEGYYELGRAYQKAGEYAKAEAALRDARNWANGDKALSLVLTRMGMLYEDMGKNPEALSFYTDSQKHFSDPKTENKIRELSKKNMQYTVSSQEIARALTLIPGKAFGVRRAIDLYINFEVNRDELNAQGRSQADELGKALTDPSLSGRRFRIIGHTDSQGEDVYNLELSERRARTVRQYLTEHFSIPSDSLDIEGKGESALLVSPELTGDDFAANRRVEVSAE